MKLERLLENIEYSVLSGSVDIEINKVNYDSRKVEKGDLFVCIKGYEQDGHKYAKMDTNMLLKQKIREQLL